MVGAPVEAVGEPAAAEFEVVVVGAGVVDVCAVLQADVVGGRGDGEVEASGGKREGSVASAQTSWRGMNAAAIRRRPRGRAIPGYVLPGIAGGGGGIRCGAGGGFEVESGDRGAVGLDGGRDGAAGEGVGEGVGVVHCAGRYRAPGAGCSRFLPAQE